MLRAIVAWIGITVAAAGYLQAAAPQEPSTPPAPHPSPHQAALDRYCVTCHNEKLKTAGLMLDKMNVERAGDDAATWEKVVRKLRTRAMPPAGARRPD